MPGPSRTTPRRRDGDGIRRGDLRVPRHGNLLVLQLRHRPLPGVSRPARRRRHQRAHRAAPRRVADERPAPDARPSGSHRAPRAPDAAHHSEAAQGERGVHVAARRPHDRRVRRRGEVRVRDAVRGAVRDAGGRRPARCSGRRPRDVPRRTRTAAGTHDRQHARRRDVAQPVGIPVPALHRVHRGSATRTARRRDDGPRHRDVSGRLDARGHRRRARRREPVRGGPGDDRSPPRDRPPPHGRAPGTAAGGARRARSHPELRRGSAAVREPDQG